MTRKQYVLYEPGGHKARGFAYGQLVQQAQLTDEDLSDCRIGFVDANGVGDYTSWQEFLDMKPAPG